MGDKKEEKDARYHGLDADGAKITSLKSKVKLAMEKLHDMATLEVMLPVHQRMKKRLESIRKMSSAESFKIDGHWKTNPPQMHIVNLQGRKVSDHECEVRFGVFDMDDQGNKKLYEHSAEIVRESDGAKIKRVISAEYRVAYEVVETIRYREPITREIINIMEDKNEKN